MGGCHLSPILSGLAGSTTHWELQLPFLLPFPFFFGFPPYSPNSALLLLPPLPAQQPLAITSPINRAPDRVLKGETLGTPSSHCAGTPWPYHTDGSASIAVESVLWCSAFPRDKQQQRCGLAPQTASATDPACSTATWVAPCTGSALSTVC